VLCLTEDKSGEAKKWRENSEKGLMLPAKQRFFELLGSALFSGGSFWTPRWTITPQKWASFKKLPMTSSKRIVNLKALRFEGLGRDSLGREVGAPQGADPGENPRPHPPDFKTSVKVATGSPE
jgi:hypothetical protein